MEARKYDSLLDEVQGEQREGFEVRDDRTADWALEQIGQAQQEIARFDRLRREKISDLDRRFAALVNPQKERIAWLENLLERYMQTLVVKPTKKGTRSYKLLNGKLTVKPQEPTYEQDADVLVDWLYLTGRSELVKVTRSPMWGELKKQGVLPRPDGTVCTGDGEVIEGVRATVRPDEFVVEVLA